MIQETVNKTLPKFRIKTRSIANYSMSSHHFHDAYEIYYMNAGTRKYFIQDTVYPVTENSLVLVKPYDIHKTMDTGVNHSRILISFTRDFIPFSDISTLIDTCFSQSSVLTFDPLTQKAVEDVLRKMVIEASDEKEFYELHLASLLVDLMVILARYQSSYKKADAVIAPANQKIYDVIHYIKNHYFESLSLEGMAEHFFISPFYLSRLFKKNTGFTVFEYIQSIRIIEAQRLLIETKLKIVDIASAVGYANVSNFGKVFKQLTGKSPLTYRKTKL